VSNSQAVLRLTFPGSLRPGERATPSFNILDRTIRVLEILVETAHGQSNRSMTAGRPWTFRLVSAQSGSLDIWVELVSVTGGIVGTFADAPIALRHLMLLLQTYDHRFPEARDHRAFPAVVAELGRVVKRAGRIQIRYGDAEIILEAVTFRDPDLYDKEPDL